MPDLFQLSADLTSIAKSVASAEDKLRLAEAAITLNEIASENRRIAEENEQLVKKLARRKALEYRDGSYYVTLPGGTLEGPICPECYDGKGFIYRLQAMSSGYMRCVTCGADYPMPPGITSPDPITFV